MVRHGSRSPIRVGIIASSGGSVFDAAAEITCEFPVEWVVITDRECGIEAIAERRSVRRFRVNDRDNRVFSEQASSILRSEGVESVLLFFTRYVTRELHATIPTYNIHPSLLPAFPGFGAVRTARSAGVRILGATLHVATDVGDGGPIVAQTGDPVNPNWSEMIWMGLSFRQKLRLAVWFVDFLRANSMADNFDRCFNGVASKRAAPHLFGLTFIDQKISTSLERWLADNSLVPSNPTRTT